MCHSVLSSFFTFSFQLYLMAKRQPAMVTGKIKRKIKISKHNHTLCQQWKWKMIFWYENATKSMKTNQAEHTHSTHIGNKIAQTINERNISIRIFIDVLVNHSARWNEKAAEKMIGWLFCEIEWNAKCGMCDRSIHWW